VPSPQLASAAPSAVHVLVTAVAGFGSMPQYAASDPFTVAPKR
jgi:hypothetical protein